MKRALVLMAHPGHGGIMRSLASLDAAASRFDWELHFAFPEAVEHVTANGLATRAGYVSGLNRWRRLTGRVRVPVILGALIRRVRQEQIALVYSATLSSFPFAHLTARACGIGDLVHVYSSYDHGTPYRKYWLQRARSAIVPSRDSLDRAAAAVEGFGEVAEVIYNGVDVDRIMDAAAQPPIQREWLSIGADSPTIGMIANLDRRKNPLALVEATARLVRRLPAIRVLLVGEFSDDAYRREVLGRAESLGVLGNVIVTGFQANPFPLATRCDVIVLPTQRDPFPIALLEAMALAKPVVATAVGGIPEMIRDGESGVVVPPNDIDALASAIAGVIEDPTRGRRLGEAARERLLARFSQEGFFGKMFDALNRAARRR